MIRKLTLQKSERADRSLFEALQKDYPFLSRKQVKAWFEKKEVQEKGRPLEAKALLSTGEHTLEILHSEQKLRPLQAKPASSSFLPILYEDDFLLVVIKTPDVPSVPLDSHETQTAVGSVLAHCPLLASSFPNSLEAGILHRLDTGTSGVLAFSKTRESYDWFRENWKTPRVKKIYEALCVPRDPKVESLPFEIDLPLTRLSSKKMGVVPKIWTFQGKPLEARSRILEIEKEKDLWRVKIQIETGVMHQVRVHLSALGLPLLGDPLYGGPEADRLYLHARRLELEDERGFHYQFESKTPF